MLDLSYDKVLDLIERDVFAVLAPYGRGRGKDLFVFTDEVELYGRTRNEQAVRDLRAQKSAELQSVASAELGEAGA